MCVRVCLPAAVRPAGTCRLQSCPIQRRWRRTICADRRRSASRRSCRHNRGCQTPDAPPVRHHRNSEAAGYRLKHDPMGQNKLSQVCLPAETALVGSCPPSLWLVETEQFPECSLCCSPPAAPEHTHTHRHTQSPQNVLERSQPSLIRGLLVSTEWMYWSLTTRSFTRSS